MNKITFEDKDKQVSYAEIPDYCTVTLKIQDGKAVHVNVVESIKLQPQKK